MPHKKISKRTVDAIKPTGKDQFLWDTQLNNFALRVLPSGIKTYIVQYRMGGRGSRQRRYTIGKHGSPWTADSARDEAARILGDVAHGRDPAGKKQSLRQGATLRELAEIFLKDHVESKCKNSTVAGYRRLLQKVILPRLGIHKVTEITRADIAKFHNSNRHRPYQANRCLAVMSKMFNLAERWGERPENSNPCLHIERYPENKRERFLSEAELSALGTALVKAQAGKIIVTKQRKKKPPAEAKVIFSPYVVAAIRLLVFTGARLQEILTLQWEWIDFERAEARLPDSKTGAKTLHFPPPAMEILVSLPRVEGNPFVIVGGKPDSCLVNLEKPWRVIRKEAKLDNLRLHDLRHAFASIAAASGMGLPIIGKMLGHTQMQTTQRYAHLASDPVKSAATTVANQIAAAMKSGEGKSAEVVTMRKRKA